MKIRIIHLEDMPADAELIERQLRKDQMDFEKIVVDNRAAFEQALKEFNPDIILSDHSLPSFDSLQALKVVKALDIPAPFILVTSTMTDEFAAQVMKEGAQDYILKDRLQRLPSAIVNAIEKHRLEIEKQLYIEQITANEKRFRALIEKTTDMITISSEDGRMLYGSPSIEKILGYGIGEFISRSGTDLIHPDDIEGFLNKRKSILNQAGSYFKNQHRVKHKNGNWIWVESTVTNLLHEPGVYAIVSNFRDISEKKSVEYQIEFDRNNLNALINNTTDFMWSVDRNFILITYNEPLKKMIQAITGKELVQGNDMLSYSLSEDQSVRFKSYYERAFRGETFSIIEHYSSPEESWAEISFFPIRKGTEIIGTACHSRDISEIMKTEEYLRQSNSKLDESQAIGQLGNWEWDFATGIITMSQETCRIMGYDIENERIDFNSWFSRIHPEDIESVVSAKTEAEKTFSDIMITYRLLMGNGVIKHIYSKGKFLFDKQQQPRGLYGIIQDITERKAAEQQIRHSEEFSKGILNSISSHIAVVDHSGTIIAVNESWNRFAQDNGATIFDRTGIGSNYFEVCNHSYTQGVAEAYDVMQGMREILEGKRSTLYLEYPCHSPAVKRWFGLSVWKFESNEPFIVVSHEDITQRKSAEIERARITNDLIQRNKDLEQFAYIISHNLRAPVANIIGISNAMNAETLSTSQKAILNHSLNESVHKLDEVVKDLNHILQVKREIKETREVVRFSELVDDIKISIRNLIDKDKVDIRCNFSEINEYLTIKSYLYSIFYNLISNSIKYKREGVPCILEIRSMKNGDLFEIVFKDNGSGIDMKKRGDQVFGLYKRFHTHIEGKGMGLFMVKTQIETLGGKISLRSEVNKGTEFKLEFEL